MIIKHLTLNANTPHSFKQLVKSKELCGEAQGDVNISNSMDQLHKLISAEMIGDNENAYEQFLILSKKYTAPGNTQPNLKLIKAEIDLATIYAVANIFGLAIVILSSCREVPMLSVVPSSELRLTSPCFLQYNPETATFTACIEDDSKVGAAGNGSRVSCTCGSKTKGKVAKKMCMVTRCRCYFSGKGCTILCQCVCCGNHKPVTESDEKEKPPPPSKITPGKRRQRTRPKEYDFKSSALISDNIEASASNDESINRPEAHLLHHAFLDALVYSLERDVERENEISEGDLPDVLYGGYLSICEDVSKLNSQLYQSDDPFHQSLPELDANFVHRWLSEHEKAKLALEEMKQQSKGTGVAGKTADSLMVLSDDSSDEDAEGEPKKPDEASETSKKVSTGGEVVDLKANSDVSSVQASNGKEAESKISTQTSESKASTTQVPDGNKAKSARKSYEKASRKISVDREQANGKSSVTEDLNNKETSCSIPDKESVKSKAIQAIKTKELIIVLEDAIKAGSYGSRKRKCRRSNEPVEEASKSEQDVSPGDRVETKKMKETVGASVTETTSPDKQDAIESSETLVKNREKLKETVDANVTETTSPSIKETQVSP